VITYLANAARRGDCRGQAKVQTKANFASKKGKQRQKARDQLRKRDSDRVRSDVLVNPKWFD